MNPIATILLVDDVAANRETFLELLDSKDYRFLEAANGPEALKLAAESPPDLVLLDVMMPGMDGYEVCRRLRADFRLAEVPVIMITALDDQGSRLAGIEAGADDFITKPFHSLELRARVRTITRLNRYRRLTQAQERIREQSALLDQARDAIIVRNLDDRITYWNKSAERLFGWTAEEAIGHSMPELLVLDTTVFQQARDKAIETEEWTGELQLIGKDGLKLIVESRWTLVRDTSGQRRGIMTINTDITESKKLEQQFLRNQRMESIGTLAGGIAHDLNNALAPILMSAQLLRMRFDDSDMHKTLDVLEASAQRGADMVKQVLTFARGIEGSHGTVQLKHLIRDMVTMAKQTFPKAIQIREKVSKDIWPINGDATQLHQVLLNLCVNARDAMPEGGALTIAAENIQLDEHSARVHMEARPGPYTVLSVIDTGTGMPPHVQERIFDPFFTTKEAGKGTGLGLSTVRSIVKNHNGFLTLETAEHKGTHFKVYLPALASVSAAQAAAARPTLPSGNGEWVLVVDDEALIRDIARQMLQTFGYHVLVASNGAEAVATCATHVGKIRVMVTDLSMPIMDGTAAIAAVRIIDPNIKVIVASGSWVESKTKDSEASTVRAVLVKPYTPETLLTTIHRVLSMEQL
jgi:two-component system cell cycle sensor histidine kinase/response regulator CckA